VVLKPARDTIVALATPYGVAAIAKVRVSGPLSRELIQGIFLKTGWSPRHVYWADFRDIHGRKLDEVCWVYFENDKSYTGEDGLEIDCHGNPLIVQKILKDLEQRGCRLAEPGEFTKRAFLNHKIDLCQAEAVLDLIHANNEQALAIASEQLSGSLSCKISELNKQLLHLLALIEMEIDFSEGMEEESDSGLSRVSAEIEQFLEDVQTLQAMQSDSERVRKGIKVVLIGEPNAGKSSLLNHLLQKDRALVDMEAGTTRDFISASWVCSGYHLELFDTAGLRAPENNLERQGIERSIALLKTADVVLWVVDLHAPEKISTEALMAYTSPERVIRVENKSDLGVASESGKAVSSLERVVVSAKTGEGIDVLRQQLAAKIPILSSHRPLLYGINERHASVFRRVEDLLASVLSRVKSSNASAECIASDLRLALEILGEITGSYDQEAMLDNLFSQFCIGK
jgi:tRNA modification GTPase